MTFELSQKQHTDKDTILTKHLPDKKHAVIEKVIARDLVCLENQEKLVDLKIFQNKEEQANRNTTSTDRKPGKTS